MNRISTTSNYQSALLNLMSAQEQQADASRRVSTQKNATDLTGFGRGSETLTALKGASSRVQGFIDTGEAVGARLEAQDLALNLISDGIGGAREAVAGALATESGLSLMLDLGSEFRSVVGGLNTQHQDNYLFGGANSTQAPVQASNMSDLAAPATVAATFRNDTIKSVSRVAENTAIETGYLADGFTFAEPTNPAVQTHVFQIFKDIQDYNDDPVTGPLSGRLTAAQKTFLTTQLSRLDKARSAAVDVTARNGTLQKRIEQIGIDHTTQLNSLDAMVAKRTDADMAEALTNLQQSQIAVQASAQVISQLRDVSLLNYLR
jgi:flagellar hook-associated protein 3 FlgL